MSFVKEGDAAFVQRLFKKYYRERVEEVYVPERLQEREFGYFTFGEKIMIRHLSFNTPQELKKTLTEKAPLHVYTSSAFYKYPRAPMEEKEWLGAELVFDIDADHLKTPCKDMREFKVCKKCLTAYPAEEEKCPRCGSRLEKVEWVGRECLEAAREEARKLLEILESDFGFEKIRMAFSGNRGYHVIVGDNEVLDLNQMERKELIDYITGVGLEPRLLNLGERKVSEEFAPDLGDPGWRGRIARAVLEIIMSPDEYLELFPGRSRMDAVLEDLEKARNLWTDKIPWSVLKPSTRKALIEAAKELASSHIDVVVTQDTHRLMRLGNSLNGKTGLVAKMFDPNDLDEFDPEYDPVGLPMDDEIHVRIIRTEELSLGGFELKPAENKIVKVPLAVAAMLLCKGAATLP